MTNLTITVKDSGGNIWAGGSYKLTLQLPFGYSGPLQASFSGSLDSNGSATIAGVASSDDKDFPAGSFWQVAVLPKLKRDSLNEPYEVPAYLENIPVSGATSNVTVTPSAIPVQK